ncbi:MAG: hypothetical protein ABSA12_09125 [Verrucomicrobiia bacterium]
MPISYSVHQEGHYIHAVAKSPLTKQEFVDYEVAHATDKRVKTPVSELFEICADALKNITMEDIREVLGRRGEVGRLPTPHRCAIALGSTDDHTRNLAKFYEGMSMLHSPEVVVVFGDADVAKLWLRLGS